MVRRNLFVENFVFGIVVFLALFAGTIKAANVSGAMSGERELLPKIWVPDPARSKRESNSLGSWYDPQRGLIPTHEIFETLASWELLDRIYSNTIAVRSFCDDNPHLIDNREFRERVKRIMSSDVSVFVNRKHAKPVFTCLDGVGNVSSNAVSVHVKIDNYHQLIGMDGTGLLSKRYLNVDGRFFYIGVVGQVREGEVRSRALQNEALLRAWEGEIRRCTWAHRLAEHGGDVESAANALKQELLADREKWEKSPYRLPLHERMELARRLMAERGFNSTNKPSREVLNGILVEAGVIRPDSGSKSPSSTASVSPTSTASSLQNIGAVFGIFLVLALIAVIVALGCRKTSGKDTAELFRAYQERVDHCLLTDRALRNVVTQRILEEWVIIIQFFSSGDERCRLCVPAVLFLWENIFEPKMSHGEVLELNERIKSACGLDKVFSRRNFESTSGDVIREIGYEPAWRNWQQLGEYAYSASDRIAGGAKLETPVGFGASVYRLLKNWDGKFDHIMMLPIDWKRFFKAHPEFAERELLVRYGVLDAEEQSACAERVPETPHQSDEKEADGALAFLDAGKDGILRGILWREQQKVVLDRLSCHLYLPKGWNVESEIEMVSPRDCVASMAGSGDHEWLSVEHLHLSPEHVHDDLGYWVNFPRVLFGKLHLHPHQSKAEGVEDFTEVSFGRLSRRDVLFMKYHNADDMAAFVGTIEIGGRLHRLFIVIVRRGADSWKFEYVFPVADGVTKDAQELRSEEIVAAARIFVPIETFGKIYCSLCSEEVDDPANVTDDGHVYVWMKDFFMFDDMRLPKSAVGIPCCVACREKILAYGVSKARLEEIPAVHEQIAKGASMLEVKCGTKAVSLFGR